MSVKKIISSQNEYIKMLSKLKTKKYRDELSLFTIEGERSCREAISSDFSVHSVVMSESYYKKSDLDFEEYDAIVTPDKIFDSLSDTKTPQGIMVVLKIPDCKEINEGRYIYCDCIQDPGNAGTIIRSADAFGFSGVIFSQNSVDVFSPKVIRSTMGSIFHIDILTNKDASYLCEMKEKGFFITASALSGESRNSKNMTILKNQIFVIGNEGAGVSEEILSLADEIVHIKMQGAAESLNASVAASVLMYEVSHHE